MEEKIYKIYKYDSSDIGFANACLLYGVVSFDEFKDFMFLIIEKCDNIPSYIFDIIECKSKNEYLSNIVNIIGYRPYWESSDIEKIALDGIGYKRFPDYKSDLSNKYDAIEAINKNREIRNYFERIFPFIDCNLLYK